MEDRLRAVIAYLAAHYPRETVTRELRAALAEGLADLPIEAVEEAARVHVRTSRFFPALSELRTLADPIPNEAEALAMVEAWLAAGLAEEPCPKCGGRPNPEETCPVCRDAGVLSRPAGAPLHPRVRQALDLVGGAHGWRNAEKPSVVRSQFLRLYGGLSDREVVERDRVRDLGPLNVPGLEPPRLREIG